MNPYESPQTGDSSAHPLRISLRTKRVLVAGVMMLFAGLFVGECATLQFEWLRSILRPRIGTAWSYSVFTVVFLAIWFHHPQNKRLRALALLFALVGAYQARLLLMEGTVAEATNTSDMLHSAWYWSVVPMFLLAVLMLLLGLVPDEAPAEPRQKSGERVARRRP